MKRVLDTVGDAAKTYIGQTQREGRGGNLSFNGLTAYSHGTPIARLYPTLTGTPPYLLTCSTRYSNSTTRHVATIRAAYYRCYGHDTTTSSQCLCVPTLDSAACAENAEYWLELVEEQITRACNPRVRLGSRGAALHYAEDLAQQLHTLTEVFPRDCGQEILPHYPAQLLVRIDLVYFLLDIDPFVAKPPTIFPDLKDTLDKLMRLRAIAALEA